MIMEFSKGFNSDSYVVYLTVNEKGETKNVFATLGKAIEDIEMQTRRIEKKAYKSLTPSKFTWIGRNDKEYSLEIKVCPICDDVRMDYMQEPKPCDVSIL